MHRRLERSVTKYRSFAFGCHKWHAILYYIWLVEAFFTIGQVLSRVATNRPAAERLY